jgi:O-antigen/teichoic acid export membrane protein
MLLQMWIIRRRRFRALAGGHVTLGIARSAGQLGAGSIGAGFLGLGLAEALSRTAVLLVLMRSAREDLRLARSVSAREIRAALSRYRHFPLFRTPSTLANNVGTAMPAALVTMAYGVSATGLYTLMATVLVAPSGLVQKAVGDVFIGHFAHEFRKNRRRAQQFLVNVALALVVLSIVPAVILRLWGAPMFAMVFGEKWRAAGHLAGIMVPVLMADFVIGPLGGALNVVNRPEAKLVFDVLRLAGLVAAYALAMHASAPLAGMMTYFSAFGVASYVVYGLLIYLGTARPKPIAGPPLDLESGGATSLLDA